MIKLVLLRSIEQGGTTLKDFLQSDGKPGYFARGAAGIWPQRRAVPDLRHADYRQQTRSARDLLLPPVSEVVERVGDYARPDKLAAPLRAARAGQEMLLQLI